MMYSTYLASLGWKRKREERILLDGGVCALCGSTHDLQVHHRNYDHLGQLQELHDTVTLCGKCHKQLHVRSFDHE